MGKKASKQRWETRPLGDLGTYINGKAFKPAQWDRTGLPIIRIQNLTNPKAEFNYFSGELEPRYLVDDGDLLISWSATLGSFIWDRGPAALNQHIFKVDVNDKIVDREFLHFLIQNTLAEMGDHTHGSTMKHITKGKFEALKVPVPPLEEQRRIVGRIKELMERVDELGGINEERLLELESLRKTLVLGQSPDDREYTIASRFVSSVSNLEPVVDGQSYKFAGIKSFGRGMFENSVKTSSDFKYPQLRRLQPGQFVYPKLMAWEGAFAMVPEQFENYVVSPEFVVFECDENHLLPEVLDTYFRTPLCLPQVHAGSTGSNMRRRRLNPKEFLKLSIPLPPMKVQQQLREVYNFEAEVLEDWQNLSKETQGLRQSILRKAFAGEL